MSMRSVLATALLTVGCGPQGRLEAEGAFSREAPIVNGTRDPQNTFLSDGEVLAVGYLAGSGGGNFCSGTLSAPRLVVTARHCVQGRSAGSTSFGIGLQPGNPIALIPVAEIRRHPDIDFAILVLGFDATELVPEVEPIPFNREALSDDWLGRWVDASGYGDTRSSDTGRFFASVEIVEYNPGVVTVDGHGMQGICYGDSGGPIIWQPDDTTAPVVVGTEQWGDSSCVDRDHLTRLDYVADWIDLQLAPGLPPELQPCGSIDYVGVCDSGTAMWCANDYLRQSDCNARGQGCGWLGDNTGFACLPTECGDTDYYGRCDAGILSWCRSNGLRQRDCAGEGSECVWVDADTGYNCAQPIECGGAVTDLATDVLHCGACDSPCGIPNAQNLCERGTCIFQECYPGFADEDGDAANGCEVGLPGQTSQKRRNKDGGCAGTGPSPGIAASLALLALLRRKRA